MGLSKVENPADPYAYGSTGPEQRRGHINEADASASRRGIKWIASRPTLLKLRNASLLSRAQPGFFLFLLG